MKLTKYAALFCTAALFLTGCAKESSGTSSAVYNELTEEEYSELYQKYGRIYDMFTESKQSDLILLNNKYYEKLDTYNQNIEKILESSSVTCRSNYLTQTGASRPSDYSPIIAAFYYNQENINTNPVVLAEKLLTDGEELTAYSSIFYTNTSPQVYSSKDELINSWLKSKFGENREYYIGHSDDDKTYYAYIITADDNLNIASFSFTFNASGVLAVCGVDFLVYTYGELLSCDPTAETPHSVPLPINTIGETEDYFTYLGSEYNFSNYRKYAAELLGSAPTESLTESDRRFEHSEAYKLYCTPADSYGTTQADGAVYSSRIYIK